MLPPPPAAHPSPAGHGADKLLDRAEMVATLASQYRLFLAGRPALPSPGQVQRTRGTGQTDM